MKGIILAGGRATRLRPLTLVTSKQLLPVYDRPMIYYPIQSLIKAGIKDILIIIAPESSGQFLNLLGSGEEFGAHFSYAVQKEPKGLPDAFIVGKNFIGNDSVTLVLGDNIFDQDFSQPIADFKSGGLVFAKKVPDPERYGVVEFDSNHNVLSIEEKPQNPKSEYIIPGWYTYDNQVVSIAANLKPSARGEIEICDVHNAYLKTGQLKVSVFDGYWQDAGTYDSLLDAGNYMAQKQKQVSPELLSVNR